MDSFYPAIETAQEHAKLQLQTRCGNLPSTDFDWNLSSKLGCLHMGFYLN
jgi:hypothetical protein